MSTTLDRLTFLKNLEGQTATSLALTPGGRLVLNGNPLPDWLTNAILSAVLPRVNSVLKAEIVSITQAARLEIRDQITSYEQTITDLKAIRDSLNG